MWIPNVRNNLKSFDDLNERIPLWERLLFPITLIYLIWIGIRATWQFWLYPESHYHLCEDNEESKEYAELKAYREYRSRIGTFRRILEKLHIVKFDRGPFK